MHTSRSFSLLFLVLYNFEGVGGLKVLFRLSNWGLIFTKIFWTESLKWPMGNFYMPEWIFLPQNTKIVRFYQLIYWYTPFNFKTFMKILPLQNYLFLLLGLEFWVQTENNEWYFKSLKFISLRPEKRLIQGWDSLLYIL